MDPQGGLGRGVHWTERDRHLLGLAEALASRPQNLPGRFSSWSLAFSLAASGVWVILLISLSTHLPQPVSAPHRPSSPRDVLAPSS